MSPLRKMMWWTRMKLNNSWEVKIWKSLWNHLETRMNEENASPLNGHYTGSIWLAESMDSQSKTLMP